ncbi:c-type cytochrome [Cribrihabitans neustonicus]|uniref:c-type cytochrome n=1 Tax=Cribrihabitans neustonicus TaxID=1429085 RepID=UPI003B5BC20F
MKRTKLAAAAAGILIGGIVLWSVLRPGPEPAVAPPGGGPAQGAAMAEVRLPAALSEDAQIGKSVYEAKCASCHGANAAGQEGTAPPLVHKIYEPGHHSDAAFLLAAKNGVRAHHWRFGNMPPVPGVTDAEVRYVVRYVRELQEENGIR